MTLNEIIEAWQYGAKVQYTHLRYTCTLPEYDVSKVEGLKVLFYRQGIKFKVIK
jgi:hypothetical protein